MIILAFENQINVSLQLKDNVYYNNTVLVGGYQTSSDPQLIGGVAKINRHYDVLSREVSYPPDGDFKPIFKTYTGQYEATNAEEIQVFINNVQITNFTIAGGQVLINNIFNITSPTDIITIKLLYSIEVDDSVFANPQLNPLVSSSFISFLKNNKVNKKSVKGYYAEVKLTNDSNEKVELFSIGSEISESSK